MHHEARKEAVLGALIEKNNFFFDSDKQTKNQKTKQKVK